MRGRGGRKRPADDGWAERGGYMNAKMQKLTEQNLADTIKSQIFNGISIYVNGYTKPSSEELKVMVTENGGVYTHYYSKTRVTHIIASNLPTSKINHLKNEKVCSPQWIVESLQAGKLLPYQKYLLYTPQNLQQNDISTSFKTFPSASINTNLENFKPSNSTTTTISENETTASSSNIEDAKTSASIAGESKRSSNLVSEFYNRSRLHHISMWGAESKAYVARLQKQMCDDKSAQTFKGLERLARETQSAVDRKRFLLRNGQKVFAHIDIDCFFVSVGLLKRPDLNGKPVAVTHSKGRDPQSSSSKIGETGGTNSRSDVASCSYEARKMGVSNGMHFGDAKKICPDLVAIPYDFEAYKRVSQQFYGTVLSYTLEVEAVSCDELYVDCTDIVRQTGACPLEFASRLRKDIFEATGCNSSCGLGSNMLIARLSTKRAKPNGQHLVEPGREVDFMREVKVSDLPGTGHVMTKKLSSTGVRNCEELSLLSMADLQKMFGSKVGSRLHKQARGEDERSLAVDIERKSVSAEINYAIRFTQKKEAEDFIKELSKEVQNRLQQLNKKGKNLTLKIKVRAEGAPVETYKFLGHGMCDNVSKSHVLPTFTDRADVIGRECCNLLALMNVPVEDLRGIGIQVTSFEDSRGQGSNVTTTTNGILKYATVRPKFFENENLEKAKTFPDVEQVIPDDDVLPVQKERVQNPANDESDQFFLSLSQVDMDTLNELPDDIQLEIRNALNKKNETADTLNNARPGCSHWNDDGGDGGGSGGGNGSRGGNDGSTLERHGKDGGQASVFIQDLKLLDESFLKAMPEDIRRELLNAQKQPAVIKTDAVKKQPPLVKSKRGRKKGSKIAEVGSSKFRLPPNQQTLTAIIAPKPIVINDRDVHIGHNKNTAINIHESRAKQDIINLDGHVEADDIKRHVKQWTSIEDPKQDDVNSLTEFLLKLVQASDIEKVFIILRSIQRWEDVSLQWKEEIKNIIATAQAAVKAIYGGKLKLLKL